MTQSLHLDYLVLITLPRNIKYVMISRILKKDILFYKMAVKKPYWYTYIVK